MNIERLLSFQCKSRGRTGRKAALAVPAAAIAAYLRVISRIVGFGATLYVL